MPFADNPYLCGSTLIEVIPLGTLKNGDPSYFCKNGTKNPPRHMSI